MRLGIDASNLRAGGGLTHIQELLRAASPGEYDFTNIFVWGGRLTLDRLQERAGLQFSHQPLLDGPLPLRLLWRRIRLPKLATDAGCDVLFVPGGGSAPTRAPWITMCRNLLPHDPPERRRYGWSWMFLRLLLLRFSQMKSFLHADGVIFLSQYARAVVLPNDKAVRSSIVIPHGIREDFRQRPREQEPLSAFSFERPFRWLYVSIIDVYKHQWQVAEAVGALRAQGLPIALDLVGPAFPPALKRLRAVLRRIDAAGEFIRYRGVVAYAELPRCYHQADGFVFASSCETFGQILVEAMASGLPIACSNRSAMPEILGEAGLYFDPEKPATIARVLRELMEQPLLRAQLAQSAYEAARSYSWEKCASQTFSYLRAVAQTRERRPCVASLES